jgi:hypothetical protein
MASEPSVPGDVIAVLSLSGLLVLLGLAVADSTLGVLIVLIVLPLIIYAMCRVPVRQSMMTLMFFAFALPNPAEGQPSKFVPPFTAVGAVLLDHLNTVDRSLGMLSSLSFSGMDVLFGVLFLIILYRKSSGSKIDLVGRVTTPLPLVQLAFVSLASAGFAWISGLVRGGDMSMSLWQLYCVLYLPIIFLLFQYSLRGPKDHESLARVILAAATYKCLLAVYVVTTVTLPMDPDTGSTRPPYATAHADSMLFAAGFVIIVALLLEKAVPKATRYAAVFLPVLVAGTLANNRRLAWVQVALVFAVVYLISRDSPLKKKLRRALLWSSPGIAFYIMAGWNSMYGNLFKPVRMIRSIVDARSDASSLWREYENVNIIATFRLHPLIGTGYGHPYEEIVVLPAVDYSLEKFVPHNSLLALWCYCGYVGYAGITMLWVAGVYFAMRSYYFGTTAQHRAAAMVSFGFVLIYMMQAWGDLGLSTWTGVFMTACALAVAGKLAVATGQWEPLPKRGRA